MEQYLTVLKHLQVFSWLYTSRINIPAEVQLLKHSATLPACISGEILLLLSVHVQEETYTIS